MKKQQKRKRVVAAQQQYHAENGTATPHRRFFRKILDKFRLYFRRIFGIIKLHYSMLHHNFRGGRPGEGRMRFMQSNQAFIHDAARMLRERSDAGEVYVLYSDITHFHEINHAYGMAVGDEFLREMKQFLLTLPCVTLCERIFADVFLCLCFLNDGTSIADFVRTCDEQVQVFLDRQNVKYPACRIGASCGLCRVENGNVAGAIVGANAALKESQKQFAVKSVVYNQAMQDESQALHERQIEIFEAMREERVCFFLQPKVDLTTGNVIGAEALARYIDKNGEVVPPAQFLDLMEQNGTIVELDRLICRQVCAFLADRIARGLQVMPISVNLSRLQIQQPDAAELFHAITMDYHLPPKLLEFELTETLLVKDFTETKRLIDQLRAYGHWVSIDDFGSGYAGINIWKELDFDCIKLDRSFLDEATKSRNEALVPNLINIAQRLHIHTLCEGVETEEQCRYLLRLGCTVVQGYFFSKPLPPEELCKLCEEQGCKYPLPPSMRAEDPVPSGEDALLEPRNQSTKRRGTLLACVACALALCIGITGLLTLNRRRTNQEFVEMIVETMNAYTMSQREKTLAEIDTIESTLKALALLIQKDNSPEFISAYLAILNEESEDVRYMYMSREEYEQREQEGVLGDSDIEIVTRLEEGESVVTDITYSNRLGGIYCIGVGVPVMRNGEYLGAVRGIVNAEMLVSTDMYDPSQGELVAVFLTDSKGAILPARADNSVRSDQYMIDSWWINKIAPDISASIHEALLQENGAASSFRIGTFSGSPYYISVTDLKYNGWHLVTCLKADETEQRSRRIVQNTTQILVALLFMVLLVSVVIARLVQSVQRKLTMEEERYLLLERFADTVLFDYDCRRDTLRLTTNAKKLFRVHNVSITHFLDNLREVYVYAGDVDTLRHLLTGQTGEQGLGEVRVRLERPDREEYFWCLVQYQYIYKQGVLTSVLGKITDIDERMRHEDYLQRMSQTDGLTGLLNKTAAEQQVEDCLKSGREGLLFVLDIDDFKQINDQYGHSVGDLALRHLGDCMQRTFRSGDVLGRIGGDEMIAFMSGVDRAEIAQRKVDLLKRHLDVGLEAEFPPITVSVGVAQYPADGVSYPELFRAADMAMYAAKRDREQGFCFYSALPKQ